VAGGLLRQQPNSPLHSGLPLSIVGGMPRLLLLLCLLRALPASEALPILRLGCDPTPPYIEMLPAETAVGGRLGGLWVDTVQTVLAELGQPHEPLRLTPWNRLLRMAEEGGVDGLFGITRSPERERYLRFADEPLLADPWLVWIRNEDADRIAYTTPEDLAGHGVGLVTGYNYGEDFVARLRAVAVVEEVADEQTNVVSTLQVGTRTAAAAGLGATVRPLHGVPVKLSVFHIAFRHDRAPAEWVAAFSDRLAAFKRTPAYAALWRRYALAGDP